MENKRDIASFWNVPLSVIYSTLFMALYQSWVDYKFDSKLHDKIFI